MVNMKKRRTYVAAVLLFAVLLAGCEYVPESPGNDTVELTENLTENQTGEENNFFADRLAGIYKTYSEQNGEVSMQIYHIQDRLIAEVEEEYAAYYAMEWMPVGSPNVNDDRASRDFTVYSFSGFSIFGEYWDDVRQITVTLTDNGFEIADKDGEITVYTRDGTSAPTHDTEKYSGFFEDTVHAALIGEWSASTNDGHSVFLRLDADGNMIWCCKKEGEPIELYIGVAAADSESGMLHTVSERVGWAGMPWQYDFGYTCGTDGKLILRNTEQDGPLPTSEAVEFIKHTET